MYCIVLYEQTDLYKPKYKVEPLQKTSIALYGTHRNCTHSSSYFLGTLSNNDNLVWKTKCTALFTTVLCLYWGFPSCSSVLLQFELHCSSSRCMHNSTFVCVCHSVHFLQRYNGLIMCLFPIRIPTCHFYMCHVLVHYVLCATILCALCLWQIIDSVGQCYPSCFECIANREPALYCIRKEHMWHIEN